MTQPRSILIVEDEAIIGMMLEDYLEVLGHVSHGVASSVAEGCAKAQAGGFDAAIVDCNLAGEKAWPVADALEERGIPFLFATGGGSSDIPDRFLGCVALAKPFTINAVGEAINMLLKENSSL